VAAGHDGARRSGPTGATGAASRSQAQLAPDEGYALVYEELKRIARHQLRLNSKATLSTTELVHEAFLKLGHGPTSGWDGRSHFFGAAARAMREVLVDFARRRKAAKRGGGDLERVSLGDAEGTLDMQLDEILALDAALDQLNSVNERLRQIVELRFFGGLGQEEVAAILGVTTRTVERNWLKARLFLLRELDGDSRHPKDSDTK
jgi:RNA polymerase sigma factor (TIGR02999 family)